MYCTQLAQIRKRIVDKANGNGPIIGFTSLPEA